MPVGDDRGAATRGALTQRAWGASRIGAACARHRGTRDGDRRLPHAPGHPVAVVRFGFAIDARLPAWFPRPAWWFLDVVSRGDGCRCVSAAGIQSDPSCQAASGSGVRWFPDVVSRGDGLSRR